MDEAEARKVLGEYVQSDGHLYSLGAYLYWGIGENDATLDGHFSLDTLKAIVWWMENSTGSANSA